MHVRCVVHSKVWCSWQGVVCMARCGVHGKMCCTWQGLLVWHAWKIVVYILIVGFVSLNS